MQKKLLLSLITGFLLLFLVVWMSPLQVKAETEIVDIWDGTVDISWYRDNESTFEITSAEQLAGVSQLALDGNSFEGKQLF